MFTKCSCQHCNGHIEFDSEYAGKSVKCPHCFELTVLTASPEQIALTQKLHSQTDVLEGKWTHDPMSDKQKAMFALYGINLVEGLTKGEATKLISQAKDSGIVPTDDQKREADKYFALADLHHATTTLEKALSLLERNDCAMRDLKEAKKQIKEAVSTFVGRIDGKVEELRMKRFLKDANADDDIPM